MNQIESSPEWHEIEDCKAIGTQITEISNERLGEVGKIAYIFHHFLNSSSYKYGLGINEGSKLLKIDLNKYNEVLEYLKDAHNIMAQFLFKWKKV